MHPSGRRRPAGGVVGPGPGADLGADLFGLHRRALPWLGDLPSAGRTRPGRRGGPGETAGAGGGGGGPDRGGRRQPGPPRRLRPMGLPRLPRRRLPALGARRLPRRSAPQPHRRDPGLPGRSPGRLEEVRPGSPCSNCPPTTPRSTGSVRITDYATNDQHWRETPGPLASGACETTRQVSVPTTPSPFGYSSRPACRPQPATGSWPDCDTYTANP